MKICKTCKELKRDNEFGQHVVRRGEKIYTYLRSDCKECALIDGARRKREAYISKAIKPKKIKGETWRQTQFDKYFVSNLGRVKRENKQLLKPETTNRNYLRVVFSIDGKTKKHSVHRLVAKAFIPNPQNKKTINHKDGNTHNNRANNLEWATQSENQLHAYRTGLQKSKKYVLQ